MQVMIAASNSMHRQDFVVLESAVTKIPNDTTIEPLTLPKIDVAVHTLSLNKTTMGIANTSPVDHTADESLLERNFCTSDTNMNSYL